MSKMIKDGPWVTMDTRGMSFRTVRLSENDAHVTFKGKGAHRSKGYVTSKSTAKADGYKGRKGAQTPKRGRIAS